jgi:hypothetical protein
MQEVTLYWDENEEGVFYIAMHTYILYIIFQTPSKVRIDFLQYILQYLTTEDD